MILAMRFLTPEYILVPAINSVLKEIVTYQRRPRNSPLILYRFESYAKVLLNQVNY